MWSDLNVAALIRGKIDLLHHVFLTLVFGIFVLPVRSACAIVAIVRGLSE
jgi:hypothetical protein